MGGLLTLFCEIQHSSGEKSVPSSALCVAALCSLMVSGAETNSWLTVCGDLWAPAQDGFAL